MIVWTYVNEYPNETSTESARHLLARFEDQTHLGYHRILHEIRYWKCEFFLHPF